MTTPTPVFDPAAFSASSWGSKLAGLRSHGATDDDPRVRECYAALRFWRIKHQVDKQVAEGYLPTDFAEYYLGLLRSHGAEEFLREPSGTADDADAAGVVAW